LFFWMYWGLNSESCACKPHPQPIFWIGFHFCLEWPELWSSYLHLPSSWNDRCMPPHPAEVMLWIYCFLLHITLINHISSSHFLLAPTLLPHWHVGASGNSILETWQWPCHGKVFIYLPHPDSKNPQLVWTTFEGLNYATWTY
jgi:hypothetical protein